MLLSLNEYCKKIYGNSYWGGDNPEDQYSGCPIIKVEGKEFSLLTGSYVNTGKGISTINKYNITSPLLVTRPKYFN